MPLAKISDVPIVWVPCIGVWIHQSRFRWDTEARKEQSRNLELIDFAVNFTVRVAVSAFNVTGDWVATYITMTIALILLSMYPRRRWR